MKGTEMAVARVSTESNAGDPGFCLQETTGLIPRCTSSSTWNGSSMMEGLSVLFTAVVSVLKTCLTRINIQE